MEFEKCLLAIIAIACVLGLVVLPLAAQTVYPEIEPNDSKPQALANEPFVLSAGDSISGSDSGTNPSLFDYFIVKTTAFPLGIYRHQLGFAGGATCTSTSDSIRLLGLSQSNGVINVGLENYLFYVGTPTPTPLVWYGFGKQEQVVVLRYGASCTGTYLFTLATIPVAATNIGTFSAGVITISTVGQSGAGSVNTELWVYDALLNAIPDYGNDDVFNSASS